MTKAKRLAARELELVTELQKNHGWAFFEMPKSQRVTMAFERRVVKGKATTALSSVRRVGVALPWTSALAEAFNERTKTEPTKAKRGAK
jgi:hypothetical protein